MNYTLLAEKIVGGYSISPEEALELIRCPSEDVFLLTSAAHKIKHHFLGNKVKLCSLINAKSGRCSENCSFCAQSAHFSTGVEEFPLVPSTDIVRSAGQAHRDGATCFSVVTSGKGVPRGQEFEAICSSIQSVTAENPIKTCASLGILSKDQLLTLKAAGLKRFHHNLETSESFFHAICTTHTFAERVETVRTAKEIGLETCCGGIFGLGETPEQRVELALTLRELDVDSVPLNILHPIPGTEAEHAPLLKPLEALRLIATYRFVLPSKDIGVLGGRESQLRDLQSFVLVSGANVILLGNYLTTQGHPAERDLTTIRDLELEVDS